MKKLLAATLFASLALSFNACSDDDTESCFEPKMLGMINDYNALGTSVSSVGDQPADVDWGAEESALPADAVTYITNCTTFVEKVDTSVKKYKDTTKDTLTSEWDRFKKTSTACQISKGLFALLGGLSMSTTTANIKTQMTNCTGVLVAAGKMTQDAATASVTTFEGWSGILQAAADYTGEMADKENTTSGN